MNGDGLECERLVGHGHSEHRLTALYTDHASVAGDACRWRGVLKRKDDLNVLVCCKYITVRRETQR